MTSQAPNYDRHAKGVQSKPVSGKGAPNRRYLVQPPTYTRVPNPRLPGDDDALLPRFFRAVGERHLRERGISLQDVMIHPQGMNLPFDQRHDGETKHSLGFRLRYEQGFTKRPSYRDGKLVSLWKPTAAWPGLSGAEG